MVILQRILCASIDNLMSLDINLRSISQSKSSSAEESFRLPKISEIDEAAGVQGNQFYDIAYLASGNLFGQLHKYGHIRPDYFLEDVFFHSMFNYYTERFTGLDVTYNYDQFLSNAELNPLTYDIEKFNKIASKVLEKKVKNKSDIATIQDVLNALFVAVNNLKENNLLKKMAAAYQRKKIVVEKLRDLTREFAGKPEAETIFKILMAEDSRTRDIQTMIFNFMKEAYKSFIEKYKKAENKSSKQKIATGLFLAQFEPSFIKYCYYKKLISELDELAKPQKHITIAGKSLDFSE